MIVTVLAEMPPRRLGLSLEPLYLYLYIYVYIYIYTHKVPPPPPKIHAFTGFLDLFVPFPRLSVHLYDRLSTSIQTFTEQMRIHTYTHTTNTHTHTKGYTYTRCVKLGGKVASKVARVKTEWRD